MQFYITNIKDNKYLNISNFRFNFKNRDWLCNGTMSNCLYDNDSYKVNSLKYVRKVLRLIKNDKNVPSYIKDDDFVYNLKIKIC